MSPTPDTPARRGGRQLPWEDPDQPYPLTHEESFASQASTEVASSFQGSSSEPGRTTSLDIGLARIYTREAETLEKELTRRLRWSYFLTLRNDHIPTITGEVFKSLDSVCGNDYFSRENMKRAKDVIKNWKCISIRRFKVRL